MRKPVRFYGPAQLPNTTGTRYTVPASTSAVLRHIKLSNPTGSPVTFTLSIGADAAGTRIYDAYSVAAGANLDIWVYEPLAAGEILAANAGTATALVVTLSGDELTVGY